MKFITQSFNRSNIENIDKNAYAFLVSLQTVD